MRTIKAIVLTCDKYRAITDHMIFCYNKIWPNHPFCFQVPYQNLSPTLNMDTVQYVKSPSDIKGTVLTLLEGLDDEEIVYWCIDDKYPIKLDLQKIEAIHQWLFDRHEKQSISGLLFCRCRSMLKRKNLSGEKLTDDQGNVFLGRVDYKQIWIHQYLKVKVIRHLFNSFPDEIHVPKEMDHLKKQVEKPLSHRLFVTKENFAVFGESTSRGVLTKNCYKSMVKEKLSIPSWFLDSTDREIIMGDKREEKSASFHNWLKKGFARIYSLFRFS